MSAIVLNEPTSLPVIRWSLGVLHRELDRLSEVVEERLVLATSEAFDAGASPFEVVVRVQTTAGHPLAGAVAVNAVAAASHAALLDRVARREVETLVAACPRTFAGVGWLQRLGADPAVKSALTSVALEALCALTADSWYEMFNLRSEAESRKRVA